MRKHGGDIGQGCVARRAGTGDRGIKEERPDFGLVIDTDPLITTDEGGHWWDVAVPEVSPRKQVNEAHKNYVAARSAQRID